MTEDDRPTSIVFQHCQSVFEEMSKQARDEGDEGLVYEGHLTKLVTRELGLATPRYTAVMKTLKHMGCVEQIQRGGGSLPSRWRLLREPEEDAFNSVEGMRSGASGKVAVVEQQLRDMNKRLQSMESDRRFLMETVRSMEQQNAALRKEVGDFKKEFRNHVEIHYDAEQMSKVGT